MSMRGIGLRLSNIDCVVEPIGRIGIKAITIEYGKVLLHCEVDQRLSDAKYLSVEVIVFIINVQRIKRKRIEDRFEGKT